MKQITFPTGIDFKKNPEKALISFYKEIGWDGDADLFPRKVKISRERWKEIALIFGKADKSMFYVNYAPSVSKDVPYDKVELSEGWIKRIVH